jgi:hypothetical protein
MRAAGLVAASGVAAGAGAVLAELGTRRRWAAAPDPTGGRPLELPPLEELTVVAADGTRLAVAVAGPVDGPLAVLAHGWTADRRIWGPLARRLVGSGRRVAVWDQRGHGSSGLGTDGPSVDALAGDVASVLDALDAQGGAGVRGVPPRRARRPRRPSAPRRYRTPQPASRTPRRLVRGAGG